MSTGYVEDVDGQLVPRSEKVTAPDNIVVPAAPVTVALTQFAQQWKAERPSTSTRFGCHHDRDAPTTVRVWTTSSSAAASTGTPSKSIYGDAAPD